MRKVLPRTVFTVLLLVNLLPPAGFSAGNPQKNIKKQARFAVAGIFTLTAPADVKVSTDPGSDVAESVYLGEPTVTGNGVVVTNNAPAYYPIGTTVVTWTATDSSGERIEAAQQVTVLDQEKPYISRRGQISVPNSPGGCSAVVKLMVPFAFDNSGTVTVTHSGPASVFPVGTTLITWTATDPSGNWDTMVQKITVIDNELPTIQISQANINATAAAGRCTASVDLATPAVADNCGVASVTNDAPAVFPVGTTVVTWKVTDLNNYVVTAQQTVTVTDNELPSITAPAAITVNNEAGKNGAAVALGTATASDNCGVASVSNNAPGFFTTGTTTVTWTVTDIHGNIATATQTVTVIDVEAPVLLVPADITVSCEKVPAPGILTVTDNCDGAPIVTMTESSTQGSNPSLASRYNYSLTRTWTATDKSGNKTSAKQLITVVDKTSPVIVAPDITAGTDADKCSAVVKYNVTVSDNSGSPLTVTYSKSSGSSFSSGSVTVTVTAKDVSGNSASKSFTVTVVDMQKPDISAPANITVTIPNNASSANNVNLGRPATADNCGIKTISNDAPASFPVGTTVVTWSAKDLAGNAATATQLVTVNKKKSNASGMVQATATAEVAPLGLLVAPNPAPDHFTLHWSGRTSAAVYLRVTDMTGRVMDAKQGLPSSGSIEIGKIYPAGNYVAELVQGGQRKTVQLIKLK